MRTTFRLVSSLLIPLLLINTCFYALAPVPAYAGEEKITRFEPESAESEATPEENDEKEKARWVPWVISVAVLGFIALGFAGRHHQTESGSGGAIDVGW